LRDSNAIRENMINLVESHGTQPHHGSE